MDPIFASALDQLLVELRFIEEFCGLALNDPASIGKENIAFRRPRRTVPCDLFRQAASNREEAPQAENDAGPFDPGWRG